MTDRPWMPLYVADYLGDTMHLSTIEHGAYLLLIMHYWQNDGLPLKEDALRRICRMTPDEWAESRDTLIAFFDDIWRHKRIDAEIATANEIINKRSAAGKAGASARYGNRIANALQTHAPSPSPSPSPTNPNGLVEDARARDKSRTPLAELETVLDPTRAQAVIDHRQRIRKPMTAHAAKLLAGKFTRCADPNAAADAMIANGWQGFEPGWLDGRENGHANGNGRMSAHDKIYEALANINQQIDEGKYDEPPLRIEGH